jgi:cobalamin biosynthesis Mg chelatase CobN
VQQLETEKKVEDALGESIDEIITALLSREVLDALYAHLQATYSISRDEVPYRLDTLLSTLEKALGPQGSKTIGKAIARKLHAKLRLTFFDSPRGTLIEYVEEAKIKLGKGEGQL